MATGRPKVCLFCAEHVEWVEGDGGVAAFRERSWPDQIPRLDRYLRLVGWRGMSDTSYTGGLVYLGLPGS